MVGGVSKRGGGLLVLAIVMLSAIVLTIPAMAAGEMTALRDISNQTVEAGTTFTVTVTITPNQDITALTLDEDLPTGWTVTEVDSAGATFKSISEEWLWLSSFSAGASKKVIYEVTVPSGAANGNHTITGSVSASGVDAISVGGASTVTVIGGSAPTPTPSLRPRMSHQTSGETIIVSPKMRNSTPNGETTMVNASVPSLNIHHLPRKGNAIKSVPAMMPGQFILRHTSSGSTISSDIN